MSEPVFKITRTQYPFDTSNIKYKTRGEILDLQRKWNTFEEIENYNNIIFQRFSVGLRNKTYYQYKSAAELKDYRSGQELHELKYPGISFAPILSGPPTYIPVSRSTIPTVPATDSSAQTLTRAETAMYVYVSTYNTSHHYQYNFASNEEQIAYNRIRLKLEAGSAV
jgi:hypothetical protein